MTKERRIKPNEFIKICIGNNPTKGLPKKLFPGLISIIWLEDVSKRKKKWMVVFDCISIN